jgi:hypothetical protein
MTSPNDSPRGPSSELEVSQSESRLNREPIIVNVRWHAGSFADFERRLDRRPAEERRP